MRLTALMAASLLGGLFHPAPRPTAIQVYGLGEWRLTVTTDTFTREVRCRIENRNGVHPDVVAVPGALAFRLSGPGLDTSDAWYRLDDQPAQPWRDLRAQLTAAGSLAEAERLDNLSGGRVLIPFEALKGAKTVAIRPRRGAAARTLALDPVWTTIASAEGLGCRFSTSFRGSSRS